MKSLTPQDHRKKQRTQDRTSRPWVLDPEGTLWVSLCGRLVRSFILLFDYCPMVLFVVWLLRVPLLVMLIRIRDVHVRDIIPFLKYESLLVWLMTSWDIRILTVASGYWLHLGPRIVSATAACTTHVWITWAGVPDVYEFVMILLRDVYWKLTVEWWINGWGTDSDWWRLADGT